MTQRNNRHWGIEDWHGRSNNLSYDYENNRVTGWTYDADGRALMSYESDQTFYSDYDARGLLIRHNTMFSVANTWDQNIVNRFYDGVGREVKRQKTVFAEDVNATAPPYGSWTVEQPTYYIRSSVLGGSVLTEINPDGTKRITNVYSGTGVLAEQRNFPTISEVFWKHQDLVTGSFKKVIRNGTYMNSGDDPPAQSEVEPFGADLPQVDPHPGPEEPPLTRKPFSRYFRDAFEARTGCVIDSVMQYDLSHCIDALVAGAATPRRGSDQAFRLGWWIDEDDPDYRPDPDADPDLIDIGAIRTRFVPFALRSSSKSRLSDAEVDRLIQDIALIFEYNPNCKDFIENVMNNMPENVGPPRDRNLVNILNLVHRSQGGVWYAPEATFPNAGGSWDAGTATIELHPPVRAVVSSYNTKSKRDLYNRQQEVKVAKTALAEAFHQAGKYYDDLNLYRGYAKWKQIQLPNYATEHPEDPAELFKFVTFWSNQWHARMDDYCNYSRVQIK